MWGADAGTMLRGLAWIVAGLMLALAFDTAIKSSLWRLQKGRFEVIRNDANAFKVRTDFGDFVIDRLNLFLRFRIEEEWDEVPFSEIERIDFGFRITRAAGREFLNGLDWWDLTGKYEDKTQYYRISLVTGRGKLPVFEVGQWLPREPFLTRFFDLQAQLLSRWGLFHDVEDRAHEVLERIQTEFDAAGHPIKLTPRWAQGDSGHPSVADQERPV